MPTTQKQYLLEHSADAAPTSARLTDLLYVLEIAATMMDGCMCARKIYPQSLVKGKFALNAIKTLMLETWQGCVSNVCPL